METRDRSGPRFEIEFVGDGSVLDEMVEHSDAVQSPDAALSTSRDDIDAARPYSELLARATASSSVSNACIVTTGPNTSSPAIAIEWYSFHKSPSNKTWAPAATVCNWQDGSPAMQPLDPGDAQITTCSPLGLLWNIHVPTLRNDAPVAKVSSMDWR